MTVSIRAGEDETGPFWENGELITLPGSQRGDISSLAITIEVPPQCAHVYVPQQQNEWHQ
eukprot:1145221-Pelagomonas_calceolata.AAC.5